MNIGCFFFFIMAFSLKDRLQNTVKFVRTFIDLRVNGKFGLNMGCKFGLSVFFFSIRW